MQRVGKIPINSIQGLSIWDHGKETCSLNSASAHRHIDHNSMKHTSCMLTTSQENMQMQIKLNVILLLCLFKLFICAGSLAEGFLKREWLGPDGEREKGAKCNELLQQLLK